MNIHITLVMHTLIQEPVELVRSLAGPETTFHIFLHSQIPEVEQAFMSLTDVPNVRLYQIGVNRGLSRSWNEGIVASLADQADVIMVCNDDVQANRFDMLRIAEASMDCPDYYLINAEGWHKQPDVHSGMQFALCAINRIGLDTIGLLDCNLYPCYWEDSEWYRRAHLAGLKPYSIGQSDIVHLGQQTILRNENVFKALQMAVPRNEAWMLKKWGGTLGQFVYEKPFDDPSYDLKIRIEDRLHPYPKYDRTDFDEIMAMQ